MTRVREYKLPNSVGALCACFADFLGFRPANDEIKVMRLAVYAKIRSDAEGSTEIM